MDRQPYSQDGLHTHHNHEFTRDVNFQRAYARGVAAAGDYRWHWRVHIGLWAAATACRIKGDFVECGVNRGFMSSAIMEYLDWNALDKTFYLLDTFSGLDTTLVSEEEVAQGVFTRNDEHIRSGFYVQSAEEVIRNFSEWVRVRIIVGSVPATLAQISAGAIAFLHIDMNCAEPEVATLRSLWDRIAVGGIVLLDDYAYVGYESQMHAIDSLAAEIGFHVASLPTGQGLVVKT